MAYTKTILGLILCASILLLGCVGGAPSTTTTVIEQTTTTLEDVPSPPAPPAETATPTPSPTVEGNATNETNATVEVKEFVVTAQSFSFQPATITVKKGDRVRLLATSTDVDHGIAIPDFGVNANMPVGEQKTIEFTADKAGTFTFFCSVFCGSGHRSMTGQLIVTE